MENKVNAPPPVQEIQTGQPPPRPEPRKSAPVVQEIRKFQPPPSADLRLVIEPVGGSYVYKTIDRRTGEVVWQYPLEEVLRMRNQESYSAGGIIQTTV